MDLKGIGCESVDWIQLAQDRANGELLWTPLWTFSSNEWRGISWQTERLL